MAIDSVHSITVPGIEVLLAVPENPGATAASRGLGSTQELGVMICAPVNRVASLLG